MSDRRGWPLVGMMLVACCGGGAAPPPGRPQGEFERLRGPEIERARRLYQEGRRDEGAAILKKLAADADWTVRTHVLSAIREVRDRTLLPVVHAALEDRSLEVREGASRVLQTLGDTSSLEPLRRAAKDREGVVRSNAAEALAAVGGVGEIETLSALLGADPDPGVRAQTASALGSLHDAAVVPPLTAALADPSPLVRARAAEALGEAGSDGGRAALEKAASSDPDDGVRAAAAAALRRLKAVEE